MQKTYYIYILLCSDSSYYIGLTNEISKREEQHNQGLESSYTFKRRPVKLVYSEEFENIWEAIYREKQLKNWSRKKKTALIKSDLDLLSKLSQHGSTGSP